MVPSEPKAAKKKAAFEEKKANFNAKKRKLQDEEKCLLDELKFDEVVLKGIDERTQKSKNLLEMKASIAAANTLREKTTKKREQLMIVNAKRIKSLNLKLRYKKS